MKRRSGKVINKNNPWVVVDRNLDFDEYVFDLCKKTGRKLSVLAT